MPDGRVYIYGSRDEPGNSWCSHSYNVLSSSDLVNWHVEQFSFATEGVGKQVDYTDRLLFAPDCIYRNEKYISIIAWPEVGKMKVLPFLLLLMVRSGMGR